MDGSTFTCPGGDGSTAVFVGAPGRAHIYRTSVQGGQGGTPNDTFNCAGGDGGGGIAVNGGRLLLAGDPAHSVQAGQGGGGLFSGYDGIPLALTAGSYARISGVTVQGGMSAGALVEIPAPRDATLRILDQVGPGDTLTFRVQTEPGAVVELLLGRKPTLGAQVDAKEVLMVVPLRTFQLGAAPANGVASLNFVVPGGLFPGFTFFGQARVTFPGGEQRYSNSVPLVVL